MTSKSENAQGYGHVKAFPEAVADLIAASIVNLHEAARLLKRINSDQLLFIHIEKARKEIRKLWKEYRQIKMKLIK